MEALRLFEETIKNKNICYNLTAGQDFCQESCQNHFIPSSLVMQARGQCLCLCDGWTDGRTDGSVIRCGLSV